MCLPSSNNFEFHMGIQKGRVGLITENNRSVIFPLHVHILRVYPVFHFFANIPSTTLTTIDNLMAFDRGKDGAACKWGAWLLLGEWWRALHQLPQDRCSSAIMVQVKMYSRPRHPWRPRRVIIPPGSIVIDVDADEPEAPQQVSDFLSYFVSCLSLPLSLSLSHAHRFHISFLCVVGLTGHYGIYELELNSGELQRAPLAQQCGTRRLHPTGPIPCTATGVY